jgi:hypothetical protein
MPIFEWIKGKLCREKENAYQTQTSECMERLSDVQEILRKMQKKDRRQRQLLELMHQEFSTKLVRL